MSLQKRSALLGVAVAAALGQAPSPAVAQGLELEEIVVTARKTEELLQSAPVAVSAFTAQMMAEQGLVNINDLARFTTGMSFAQAFGRTSDRPVIRGQANVLANVQFGVESGVAYFVDGVYYSGDIQSVDVSALERVEVIKGPQSALYGRNTYSGAINFVTRAPTEGFEAAVRATLAQFGEQDYSFSLGGNFFDDRFGARLFARSYEYDGEYQNTLTGQLVGSESTKSVGLSLYWRPIDTLSFRSNVIYREDDDGPLALYLQRATLNNCRPGYRSTLYRDPPPTGPTNGSSGTNNNQWYCGVVEPGTVALNTDPLSVPVPWGSTNMQVRDGTAFDGVENEEWFGTLRADWDIGGSGWVLTSLSGYRDLMNRFGTDSDHSAYFGLFPTVVPGAPPTILYPPASEEPFLTNTNRDDVRSKSTELRLASPQDRRLRGLIGYYYYDQEYDSSDLTFAHPAGGGYPDYTESITDDAYFGLVAFDITDRLTLTGELRYAEETKKREDYCSTVGYSWYTKKCASKDNVANSIPLGGLVYEDEATFDSTTPRITLDWRFTDEVMFYAVYAEGAKPGGLNGATGYRYGRPDYDQEESRNYELGSKVSAFDNRMRLNSAVYFIDATDVQFTQAISDPVGQGAVTSVATNQGAGEIYGLEADLQAVITEAITLSAGYSYVHTEVTKGCDDWVYTLNTGGLIYDPKLGNVKECSIKGQQYPLTPEQTAYAVFNYDAPASFANGLSWIGNFGVSYEGSKYVQLENLAETGSATLVNLRLGIRSDNGWSVVAFGRNLTDVDAVAMATRWGDYFNGSARVCSATVTQPCLPAASATQPAPGAPGGADNGTTRGFFGSLRKGRTFGVEFRYDFKL